MQATKCKKCGSIKIVKCGHRKMWSGGKQLKRQAYLCNNCGSQFTDSFKGGK